MSFDWATFNPEKFENPRSLEALPPGKYACVICDTAMEQTSKGDGQYLSIELEVISGPFKGRKLWDNINLVNPKEETVQIAQETLASICRAVGKARVTSPSELHNLKIGVKTGLKKYQGEDRSKILKYAALSPRQAVAPVAPADVAPVAPADVAPVAPPLAAPAGAPAAQAPVAVPEDDDIPF